MSDTIQSAENYSEELISAVENAITKGTAASLITGAIDIAKLIKKRDADIRADEARKQAKRCAACEKERDRYLSILKTLHSRGPALEGFVDDPDDCWDYGASLFGDEEDPQDDDPRWFDGWINMIEAAQKRDAKALADLEVTK